ncbi:MAG TPA: NAD(P)-binding domain-containing protein, partial [Thermoleophilia bacterium]
MDIGIIGSGRVAQTLATKLLELGHSVTISSRDTTKAKDLGEWGTLPSAEQFAAAQRELGGAAAAGSF